MKTHKRAYQGVDIDTALCNMTSRRRIIRLLTNNNQLVTCKTCLALIAKQCKINDHHCVYHSCMGDDCRYDVMKKQGFDVTIIKRNCDR